MEFHGFDDEYVARLREGDRATSEHFARYFGELILIKARGKVASHAAFEDIRQEVFLRVLRAVRSPDGLRRGAALGAFVASVCNNVMMESFRSNQRTNASGAEVPDVPDSAKRIDEELMTAETCAQVRRVLGTLEPRDAQILRALFIDERDKDDVCAEFNVDRAYLRVLLFRARAKFRKAYPTDSIDMNRRQSSLHQEDGNNGTH